MAVEEQTTGTDWNYFFGSPYGLTRTRIGQKLTISNRTVSNLAFTLYRLGTISGDISFSIRAADDDEVLATKVLSDASVISTSATQYEVEFDDATYINEEVRIVVDWPSASYDTDDYLRIVEEHSDVKASEGYTFHHEGAWNDTLYAIWDATYKYTYIPGVVKTFPSEAITRVTNLIHRYNRKEGIYELEMSLGEVTSDFGLPEWASASKTLATNREWEENMKRIIDDVRSYGIIPTPGQVLGPLGRAARDEQIFIAPEPAPRQPTISERAAQFTFPGFTAPGEPVSTAKVTEERPVTLVKPGALDKMRVGITESIKRLMRFR